MGSYPFKILIQKIKQSNLIENDTFIYFKFLYSDCMYHTLIVNTAKCHAIYCRCFFLDQVNINLNAKTVLDVLFRFNQIQRNETLGERYQPILRGHERWNFNNSENQVKSSIISWLLMEILSIIWFFFLVILSRLSGQVKTILVSHCVLLIPSLHFSHLQWHRLSSKFCLYALNCPLTHISVFIFPLHITAPLPKISLFLVLS